MLKHEIISIEALNDYNSEVLRLLKEYYPIGCRIGSKEYQKSEQTKRLEDLIKLKIQTERNYKSLWVQGFCKKLSRIINRDVIPSTMGIAPNMSAYILLEGTKNSIEKETLHIYLSLIGCYYYFEVLNTDKTFLNLDTEHMDRISWGVKSQIVSPYGKHKTLMKVVEKTILEIFVNAKFLPFKFELLRLKSFQVNHSNSRDCSVCDGFFSKITKLATETEILGDVDYKGLH